MSTTWVRLKSLECCENAIIFAHVLLTHISGGGHNVTVGDTVQALAAMLCGAAISQHLQPVHPGWEALVQIPDLPRNYGGNGVVHLRFSLPPGWYVSDE